MTNQKTTVPSACGLLQDDKTLKKKKALSLGYARDDNHKTVSRFSLLVSRASVGIVNAIAVTRGGGLLPAWPRGRAAPAGDDKSMKVGMKTGSLHHKHGYGGDEHDE